MKLKEKISRYMDAGFPVLYINSFEETQVENIIKQVADRKKTCFFSIASGYGEYSSANNEWLVPLSKNEYSGLEQVINMKLNNSSELDKSIFVIKDAHIVLDDKNLVSEIKELVLKLNEGLDSCVILISPIINIPPELEKYITILESDYLEQDDVKKIIQKFVEENALITLAPKLLEDLAIAFKGLSEFEIGSLLALAVADDGQLSRNDLSLIFEQKKQMILKSGILEMIPLKENINDIGGLENLKVWLQKKAKVITNMNKAIEFGVDVPKGVLIAGVPGCGKSLCAKVTASLFGIPLLRLDMGKLMGKYLGESEANLRKAISLAEAISPCVLWIDELEKAFAGANSDGGHEVTTRLFGSFLTWMQEKKSEAFVVATANDITKLPPELLRKGRFDEIFYVGLPNKNERKKILQIHIEKRRNNDLSKIDLEQLALKTVGYSGADIEGVVKEAVETVFADDRSELSTNDILNVINETNSLSVIMKESLDKMESEYKKRKLKNASR